MDRPKRWGAYWVSVVPHAIIPRPQKLAIDALNYWDGSKLGFGITHAVLPIRQILEFDV